MAESPFTPELERIFACVLDELIPARSDGLLPGAGALGVGSYVVERLGDSAAMVAEGLAELEARAVAEAAEGYEALAPDRRTAILNEIGAEQPGLLPGLIFHTYTGYYQEPRVLEALGMEPRPPFPKGYELETGDLGLLAPVKKRPKLYRSV